MTDEVRALARSIQERDKLKTDLTEALERIYKPLVVSAIIHLREMGERPSYLGTYYRAGIIWETARTLVPPDLAAQLDGDEFYSVLEEMADELLSVRTAGGFSYYNLPP